MFFMCHETYPVWRSTDPQLDFFGHVLPELPTKQFPTAQYQYHKNIILNLPDPLFPCDARGALDIKITRHINVAHGLLNQVIQCEIVNGHESVVGAEVVGLVYDPLYVDISDLPIKNVGMPPQWIFLYDTC